MLVFVPDNQSNSVHVQTWRLVMYRQRRAHPSFSFIILLGVLAGCAFLVLNSIPLPDTNNPMINTPLQMTPAYAQNAVAPNLLAPTAIARSSTSLMLPNAGVYAPIIDVFIRDGDWDVATIGANVGHLFGTAPLTTVGNHGLAGHSELRDGSRGIFAWIQALNYGDAIQIEVAGVTQEYRVTGLRRVEPNNLSVLNPTVVDRLTLITCDNYDFLRNLYLERIVVVAERVA